MSIDHFISIILVLYTVMYIVCKMYIYILLTVLSMYTINVKNDNIFPSKEKLKYELSKYIKIIFIAVS